MSKKHGESTGREKERLDKKREEINVGAKEERQEETGNRQEEKNKPSEQPVETRERQESES